ncbi:MAG: MFS transporter [Firmicutes bacterium]|nr:MFS transporter [Candidatus Colivicinus equi]
MSFKKITKRHLFIISIVISAVLTIFSFNKDLFYPFDLYIELNNVADVCLDDDYSLVLNEGGKNLLFLKDNKLEKNVKLDASSLIDNASEIIRVDDCFYVVGYNSNLKCDRIIRYDLNGNKSKCIYEIGREAKLILNPIQDISYYNNKLYIVKLKDNNTISVIEINLRNNNYETILDSSPEGVLSSQYLPEERKLLMSLQDGSCVLENIDDGIYSLLDEKNCVFIHNFDGQIVTFGGFEDNDIKVNGEVVKRNVIPTSICYQSNNRISYDNEADTKYYVYDINTKETTTFDKVYYSPVFWVQNLQRILPIAYLIMVIIYVIVDNILYVFHQHNDEKIRKMSLFIFAVFAVLFIAVFYTREMYENNRAKIVNELKFGAKYLSSTIDRDIFADGINYFDLDDSNFTAIDKYIDLCNEGDLKYGYCIYKHTDDGTIIVHNPCGVPISGTFVSKDTEIAKENYSLNEDGVYQYTSSNINTYYDQESIYIDGKKIGTLEFSIDYESFSSRLFDTILSTTTKLSVIAIVVYIVYIELKSFFEGLKKRRELIEEKVDNDDLALIRPFSLLFNFAFNMDAAILILISQDLLASSSLNSNNNILLTLPTIAKSLSSCIGALIFSRLSRHVSYKKLFIVSEGIYAIFEILVVFAIMNNNYLLFSLFILIGNVANGVGYGVFASLPQRQEDETRQIEASQKSTLGDTSAGLLAGLLSGIVADLYGNSSVYIISTCFIVGAIIMASIILPSKIKMVDSNAESSAGFFDNIKFFTSPVMLAFILVYLLPKTMLDGYNSFLFPLFATNYGLTKTSISFINILVKSLAVGLTSYVISLFEGIDYWRRDIIVSVLCGVMFMGFIINDSIVWAIIALLFVTLSTKVHESLRNALWIRQARAVNLNPISLSGGYSTVLQIVETIKSPILSILLSYPNNVACFLLGAYIIISTGDFILTTRNTAINKPRS